MIFEKWAEQNDIPEFMIDDLQDRLDMIAITVNWASEWGISDATLAKLLVRIGVRERTNVSHIRPRSETAVTSVVKLEAADYDIRLTRNNVGVTQDQTGRAIHQA